MRHGKEVKIDFGVSFFKTFCQASFIRSLQKNNWVEETCWHGIRFADFSTPFSHKDNAEGYRPDLDSLIKPIAYGLPVPEMDKYDLFYEMRYSACSFLPKVAGSILKRRGITASKDANPRVVLDLLKKEVPNLHFFQDFSVDSQIEPISTIHYEFDLFNTSFLPNTENIIFQVVITDQPIYSGHKITSKNLQYATHPLCDSCKRTNVGLITLHTSTTKFETCSLWPNGLSVHFNSKMRTKFSIQDERFFVLEQFIRQFRLWEKYK